MAQWSFITQHRNGPPIADLVALSDRRLLFQLGQPGIASGTLRIADPLARRDSLGGLAPGLHEMKVLRDGDAVETVFQLARTSIRGTENTVDISLEWHGIASYLQDALVYPQAAIYDGTTLPWTWINAYQSRTGAALGITQGTVTGSAPNRQVSIEQEASLFEQITNLSRSADGFDWVIDTERTYREWHSQRGQDRGLVLEPGRNVIAWSYDEDTGPGEIVTDIIVKGAPGSADVTASDTTSRSLYARREAVVTLPASFEPSTVTDGQLQAFASAAMAARVAPIIVPQFRLVRSHPSVAWGSYWLGDIVTFRTPVGLYDSINQPYRIVQIEVNIDDEDNETVTLGVNAL
jgi:hypothetical protein